MKRCIKSPKNDLVIEISTNSTLNDENVINEDSNKERTNSVEGKKNILKLNIPEMQ